MKVFVQQGEQIVQVQHLVVDGRCVWCPLCSSNFNEYLTEKNESEC